MKTRLLIILIMVTFISSALTTGGCFAEVGQAKTLAPVPTPQMVFSYGSLHKYWTEEDKISGGKTVKGLSSWRFSLDKSIVRESEAILRSPFLIPYDNCFKPKSMVKDGTSYKYSWKFDGKITKNSNNTAIVPHITKTWSQFSTGMDVNASVSLIDSRNAVELVTIKVTPKRALGMIWMSLETGAEADIISGSAEPSIDKWNVQAPKVNKEYTFKVKLKCRGGSGQTGVYKPGVNIGAMTASVPAQIAKDKSVQAPGLGSLTFQSGRTNTIGVIKSDQIAIYLWQRPPYSMSAPVENWGFEDNKLLYSSIDSRIAFVSGINGQSFDKHTQAVIEWIDPGGKTFRTSKTWLDALNGTDYKVSDVLKIDGSVASKPGVWHIRLYAGGELLLEPFFTVAGPGEENRETNVPDKTDAPHFVVDDGTFKFVGAFVPDWDLTNLDGLMSTAKMSGINVLTLMLPYSQNYGDEESLKQLDYFIDRASRYGIRVIITLLQGINIATDKTNPFYHPGAIEGLINDAKLKASYKEFIARIVKRRNTVSGRIYRDDPAIMAWDLMTEPIPSPMVVKQRPDITADEFGSWLKEITTFTKSLDPNHLVTMCHTGALGELKDWPDAINASGLDFIFLDVCLYDILDANQDISDDYLTKYLDYDIFSLGKPVVPQLCFTSAWLTEKFASDYSLQGKIYEEALRYGFKRGMAGATVSSWGFASNPKQSVIANAKQLDRIYLTYDATNQSIVIPVAGIAEEIAREGKKAPADRFVKVK